MLPHQFTSRTTVFCAIFLLVALSACDSSDPEDENGPEISGVLVANQGNFSDDNGSITVYDQVDGTTAQLLVGLGSTVQSLFVFGSELFILSNSANRIDVISLNDQSSRSTIEGVLSPRYMALVSANKAYVTNLFASQDSFTGGKVTILDLSTRTISGSIPVGDNPEGIAVVGRRAVVTNSGFGSGRSVSIIDTDADSVISTLDVECDGPRLALADQDQEVWIFCTGNEFGPDGETNGAVRVINPNSLEIVARIEIDGRISTVGPGQDAAVAHQIERAYAVRNESSLLRFDTRTNSLMDEIGPLEGPSIGAVAIDELDQRIYVGRVPSFTESGEVTVHDLAGQQLARFVAGIAPTHIVVSPTE